jgi:exo-beta-1,3-glucanase (GH17 family)
MRLSSILSLAAAISSASAAFRGFNLAGHLAGGQCRSENDWQLAFERLATLPGGFENVRLYASGDCNTLENAVPAAIRTGTKLLVGVWTQDAAHFDSEKQALLRAVQEYGSEWILAVSVGSEDLYRKETDPNYLAQQIWDVRGMLWSVGASPTIGHVDTWTAWVDPNNKPVIDAVDWLGNDAYAYFEGKGIANGEAKDASYAAHDRVVAVSGGKEVWTTETGWPIKGDTIGNADASVQNLQSFWWDVACGSFASGINTFWYILVS